MRSLLWAPLRYEQLSVRFSPPSRFKLSSLTLRRRGTGRQLHTRTSQALSLAPTYASFRQELTPPFPSGSDSGRKAESSAHAAYIRFFNLVWLATNDLIIGYALSSFLAENQAYFSGVVGSVIQVRFSLRCFSPLPERR